MRRIWFWLLGWRSGTPRSGTYLVQRVDSSFSVEDWWEGGYDWRDHRRVRYWQKLRGPIPDLPVRLTYTPNR
jgi:hypothetical protein